MLKFPDDTQVRVNGLDEIMADLYCEGRPANEGAAEEIIKRLEAKKNYIPLSDRTRKQYSYVLLKEYRGYVADRAGNAPKQSVPPHAGHENHGKKGVH
jgi:hypothetical protein